jgi:hypothetical protein
MSSYISSNNNRFYVATESSYGMAAEIQSYHRIPAVKLKAKQEREHVQRRDKNGSRTFPGLPASIRRVTSFGLNTYMTGWGDQQREPAHGALFTAAMGGSALMFSGAPIASSNGTQIVFAQPHGLSVGQAIAVRAEIRFVVAVVDSATVQINAPFSLNPAGVAAIATATYRVANSLPSASIFDYWDPNGAVQRVVAGAAIDRVTVKVNGDFHEFEFSGAAADLVDSSSFTSGMAGLQQFPVEPQAANFDYSIIPGHLGQAWIGSVPNQFFTLTSAQVQLDNGLDLRNREFGADLPRAIVPGFRNVSADFTVFAQDDAGTAALYQAARQSSPVEVMLQLGTQPKQMFGVHLRSVMPQVPEFDDSETRLQWAFRNCRAQGVVDDEITVAFA